MKSMIGQEANLDLFTSNGSLVKELFLTLYYDSPSIAGVLFDDSDSTMAVIAFYDSLESLFDLNPTEIEELKEKIEVALETLAIEFERHIRPDYWKRLWSVVGMLNLPVEKYSRLVGVLERVIFSGSFDKAVVGTALNALLSMNYAGNYKRILSLLDKYEDDEDLGPVIFQFTRQTVMDPTLDMHTVKRLAINSCLASSSGQAKMQIEDYFVRMHRPSVEHLELLLDSFEKLKTTSLDVRAGWRRLIEIAQNSDVKISFFRNLPFTSQSYIVIELNCSSEIFALKHHHSTQMLPFDEEVYDGGEYEYKSRDAIENLYSQFIETA